MTMSAEEYQASATAAGYQKYLAEIEAAEQQAEKVAEYDAAVAEYEEAGHRRHDVRVAAVAKYSKLITKNITDLFSALTSSDVEVGKLKAQAVEKGLRAYGKGGFVLTDFVGGRIDNIARVVRIVNNVLTEVTR